MFLKLITFLQALPVEISSLLLLILSLMLLLGFMRFYGADGITLYVCIAVIASNIQALKVVQYTWMPDPVAFGTILFSTIFLATDILTEYYGRTAAQRAINMGFAAMFMMSIQMLVTIGVKAPLSSELGREYHTVLTAQEHLRAIFLPTPALFGASLIAYYVSQYLDIVFYSKLSQLTSRRWLWLRTNVSTIVAAFIDNALFSLLAWIILAPEPLNFEVVLYTYILATFVLRGVIALICTPAIYLARYCYKQP